jgi:hypothetical protein
MAAAKTEIRIVQTEYKGYDWNALEKFYRSQYRQALKLRKTEAEAHDLAAYFCDYYKHQFRAYA